MVTTKKPTQPSRQPESSSPGKRAPQAAAKPTAPAIVSPLKCWRCERELADAAGPGTSIRCMRCGARTQVPE